MIPAPHMLAVRRRSSGALDAHGNPALAYGPPLPWRVHAVGPVDATEPWLANRDLSRVALIVYAPASADAPTRYDRVVVDGVEYDVDGDPEDFTRGPWRNPVAGIAVSLKWVDG